MAKRHRLLLGGEEHAVTVDRAPEGAAVILDDGDPLPIEVVAMQVPGTVSLLIGGRPHRAFVARKGPNFEVTIGERRFVVTPAAAARRGRGAIGGAEDQPGQITAPLAGVVVEVRVAVGDVLEGGDTVLVLEAMKMQNEVQIPRAGTVTAVHVSGGQGVEKGALLVEYDATEDSE